MIFSETCFSLIFNNSETTSQNKAFNGNSIENALLNLNNYDLCYCKFKSITVKYGWSTSVMVILDMDAILFGSEVGRGNSVEAACYKLYSSLACIRKRFEHDCAYIL